MKNISKVISLILLALPLILSQCKKITEEPVCIAPATITVNNITNLSADFTWSSAVDAKQYLFEYRKVGTTTYTVVRVTSGTSTQVINLAAATNYEYRLQTNCPSSNSSYSEVKQFITKSNNEVNIVKKWRMKFYKENNVEVALGANDYMDFASAGALSQSLTVGGVAVVSSGTWSLFSNSDSININLSTLKKWKIESLSANNFLLVKTSALPLTTIDSLRFELF